MVNRTLQTLVRAATDIGAIRDVLNATDHSGRMDLLYGLQRRSLARLYELSESSPALTLDFFVGDAAPLVPVVHEGWNSVPVPRPWRRFQKIMCRPDAGTNHLMGYNEYRSKGWLGPGYFELMPTAPDSGYPENRGAYVVDYYRVPSGQTPHGWPAAQSNTKGLSRFVYGGTRDYLRRVSDHVSVGRPFQGDSDDRELDYSFVLCRKD